ncbi:helix-turn-helix domain-containing protein [Ensifer soli]|uniref:helix-turn-helix domain-containing protein n=1 Tax=Ciceribacter sp. sgz301302 TaxID=3342379 RepID=UPI0035BA75FA
MHDGAPWPQASISRGTAAPVGAGVARDIFKIAPPPLCGTPSPPPDGRTDTGIPASWEEGTRSTFEEKPRFSTHEPPMTSDFFKTISFLSPAVDAVENFISQSYAPVSVKPLGYSPIYGLEGVTCTLGDVFLEWSTTIGSIEITPETSFDAVLFNFLRSGGSTYTFPQGEVEVGGGQVIGYRHASTINILDTSRHDTVVIPDALLTRRLALLLDRPVTKALEFHREALDDAIVSPLSTFAASMQAPLFGDLAHILVGRSDSLTDVIIDSFLLGFPSNFSASLGGEVPAVMPRQVKRAIDFIEAHPNLRSSPETLAALSSVSVRSLQYSFTRFTGQTIGGYQLALRLRLAHDDVVNRPDLSLKHIAEYWGFGTQSVFTQSFKKAFGATPSQLRKDRKIP